MKDSLNAYELLPPSVNKSISRVVLSRTFFMFDQIYRENTNICDTKWAHYENIVYDVSSDTNLVL